MAATAGAWTVQLAEAGQNAWLCLSPTAGRTGSPIRLPLPLTPPTPKAPPSRPTLYGATGRQLHAK